MYCVRMGYGCVLFDQLECVHSYSVVRGWGYFCDIGCYIYVYTFIYYVFELVMLCGKRRVSFMSYIWLMEYISFIYGL